MVLVVAARQRLITLLTAVFFAPVVWMVVANGHVLRVAVRVFLEQLEGLAFIGATS